jgi:hypothetical protein
MKRKEKLMVAERARFDKNLSLMAFSPNKTSEGGNEVSLRLNEGQNVANADPVEATNRTTARWAAIREHISRTMETIDRNPASK